MRNESRIAQRVLRQSRVWLLALFLLFVVGVVVAYAQVGGGYTLTWWTIDSGGQQAATGGGGYTLRSTVGQPDADPVASFSEKYTLLSGFWPSARNVYRLYLPIVEYNASNH